VKYGSVCSGIEAATAAWHSMGWTPAFFAEIDPFCCALLKEKYPEVPNYGDFTKITREQAGDIDLLVGGTPCQSFSVAGKRGGLDDARGILAFEFLRLAERLRPRWILFENVPGLLSSDEGRDFGAFIGEMGKCGYSCAWRILDAQFTGVAQRRERVFVVGYLGDWRNPAAVLFDGPGMCWNPPPSREKGERIAPTIAGCSNGGGADGPGRTVDDAESLIVSERERERERERVKCAEISPTLNTSWADRAAGSTAQEWDSEKGGRFVVTSEPSTPETK
jgi:DNA (cytosine-5)-methyltransferase 1